MKCGLFDHTSCCSWKITHCAPSFSLSKASAAWIYLAMNGSISMVTEKFFYLNFIFKINCLRLNLRGFCQLIHFCMSKHALLDRSVFACNMDLIAVKESADA